MSLNVNVSGNKKLTAANAQYIRQAQAQAQVAQALQQTQTIATETQDEAVTLAADNNTNSIGNSSQSQESSAALKELQQQKAQIEEEITTLQAEADEIQANLDAQKAQLSALNAEYQAEQSQLSKMQTEYANNEKELENLNKEIAETQEAEQSRYDQEVSRITDSALDDYNPETDGEDFNAFLNKKLSSVKMDSSTLDRLNSRASALADSANSLAANIQSKMKTISNLSEQISAMKDTVSQTENCLSKKNCEIKSKNECLNSVSNKISNMERSGAGKTGTEVISSIADAEKDFVKDYNIDLTEKLEDGSSRYLAAQGRDGNYHIYDMGNSGKSLARIYGDNAGYDVVPNGSGELIGMKDCEEGQGKAVYCFTNVCDNLCEATACCSEKTYDMCSPLSFDVDGDGINTSSETIQYDIDGDGKLDTINNSKEWVLAFDKDGNGIAGENGSELFGDNTDLDGDGVKDGYANGFEALKALAQKENLIDGINDNQIDANDLKLLQEKYGLVMANGYGGETKTFEELGITEINLAQTEETKLTKNFDGRNNDIMTQEGATFKVNGQTREYADIWNAKLDSAQNTQNNLAKKLKSANQTTTFEATSKDLDSELDFLNEDNGGFAKLRANTKSVDYNTALRENKRMANAEAEKIIDDYNERLEEQRAKEEAEHENENSDDDFISFQKKKIR